jgi:hypothetical protein
MARRKRRQPAALRKYWATHRRGKKRSAPKRRKRARRNWINTGAVSAINPPRRRRRTHRKHAIRRHRRGYRRNPSFMGFELPAVKSVIFAGVGFAGPSVVQGFLTQLAPSVMQQATSMGMLGKYLVKAGTILGLQWVTKRFVGTSESHMVLIGGGVNIGLSLVNDFAPGFLPANPLSMYTPVRPGLRAYVPVRPGLRAVPAPVRQIPTAAPFRDLTTSGPFGSAIRYQRY